VVVVVIVVMVLVTVVMVVIVIMVVFVTVRLFGVRRVTIVVLLSGNYAFLLLRHGPSLWLMTAAAP
jgi:hypothetical protein